MKYIIFPILLLACVWACRDKKDPEPEPLPELRGIVSKWRLTHFETKQGDSTIVDAVPTGETSIIAFRYDGILMNGKGEAACCAPSSYLINGTLFEVKRIGPPPPPDLRCIYADCAVCPQWILAQTGDSLIIDSCLGSKMHYVREE